MQRTVTKQWLGVLCLACAGCLYGLMAPLVRIANVALPPFQSIFLRYAAVTLFLVTVRVWTSRPGTISGTATAPWRTLLLIGLSAGVSNVAYALSVLTTTVGDAVFLVSLYVVLTPVLGLAILREQASATIWVASGIAVLGAALLVSPGSGTVEGDALGIVAAVGASLVYVFTRAAAGARVTTVALSISLGSLILDLPPAMIELLRGRGAGSEVVVSGYHSFPVWMGWLALLVFAGDNLLISTLMPIGFRYVAAATGGVILLLEPIVGVLFGVVMFGEVYGLLSVAGASLILLGSAVAVWAGGRVAPPQCAQLDEPNETWIPEKMSDHGGKT